MLFNGKIFENVGLNIAWSNYCLTMRFQHGKWKPYYKSLQWVSTYSGFGEITLKSCLWHIGIGKKESYLIFIFDRLLYFLLVVYLFD